MSVVTIERWSGCCGNVSSHNDPEEPGLLHCDKCGKTDYPEAFEKMELSDENIHCPHCNKTTKHELYSFDWWSGWVETDCTECKKRIVHNKE